MIKFKCDICNKNTTTLETVILHKRTIDFCTDCKQKVDNIVEEFYKEKLQEYLKYEQRLKQIEKDIINKM